MSGLVTTTDAPPDIADCGHPEGPTIDLLPSRAASVGGLEVRRPLPRRQRRTVGAWCFADHFGPVSRAGPGGGIPVGPHPHTGLQTVTWLVAVGDEVVRPGVLVYLGRGREELVLDMPGASRALLLDGWPFAGDLLMWWNFVARTRGEIEQAWTDWEHGTARFGRVVSDIEPIPAPRPSWLPSA